jgi:hypothetical protein
VKSGMNCFSWHSMGLNEFPDTLLPVILHFSGDMGDGSLCTEMPLIRHRQFTLLLVYLCFVFSSSLVTVYLLDNFLKLLKAFCSYGE